MLLKINYICKKISMSKETIKIAKELERLPLIRIGDIQELQGNLKDLTEVNYQKLLKRLEKVGFKYPLYIWFDKNKTPYTLDGKQRHRVIQKEYGADIKLPYIEVYAKNKIEAKKEILAISSDYGTVTKDGFDDFVGEFSEFDYSEIFLETTFDKWADNETLEAEEDNFEVPENIKTDIVLGDLFEIGEHRLLCGDSTCSDSVAKLMNGEKADMVFTDPPYGISVKNTKGDILGDGDLCVFENCLPNILLNVKEKTHAYIFFGSKLAEESLIVLNKYFKQYNLLIMPITNQTQPYPECYFSSNYEICYFTNINGVRTHNSGIVSVSETTKKDNRYNGDGYLKKYYALSEQPITEHNANNLHPTQKNVKGIGFFVLISSNENDLVLDLFLGSGSTMVAAHQLKRKCYGMELDPKYCDVIIQRMLKLDNTLTIKRNGIEETEKWLEKIES